MIRNARFATPVLLVALGTLGCAQIWEGRGGVLEMAKMSDAYGNEVYLFGDIDPDDVTDLEVPERLRPCCAFGSGLGVSVGQVPIYGFTIENVLDLDDLGGHKYNNGILSLGGSDGAAIASEKNGLLYTCRGGFIDSAHLRDYADWMAFFAAWMAKRVEAGGEIELSSEAGVRRVILQPIDPKIIRTERVRALALALARYVSFRLSIWHEIASWYGWSALSLFPERASAFSPEDLYSNLLGIELASSLIEVGAAGTEQQYNRNMDLGIEAVMERLGIIDNEAAVEVAVALDGHWWDSSKRLPDPHLVKRRHMEIGKVIRPWLASEADSEDVRAVVSGHCRDGQDRIDLPNRERVGPHELSSLIRLEIEIEDDEKYAHFPFPRAPSRIVTDADFAALIEDIRADARVEFGPGADVPGGVSE